MFLVTCPMDGSEHVRSVSQIVDHANTAHGVLTAVSCACGGQAILDHGNQVAHATPGGQFVRTA